MIDIILLLGVVYCVFVATYLLSESSPREVKLKNRGVDRLDDEQIVKIRHFTQSQTIPVATTPQKTESTDVKEPTFVPKEAKLTSQVPSEKLDDLFSDTPEDVDIIPLKYEEGITEDELDEELESNNGEARNYASGFRIDEFKDAIKTANSSDASIERRDQAGELFCKVKGSSLFEQLNKNEDVNMNKIKELMNFHLQRMDQSTKRELKSPKTKRAGSVIVPEKYEDFNVFDIL